VTGHNTSYNPEYRALMKLFIMQFSPSTCHILSFRSQYTPPYSVSNILNLCPSLHVRDKVSHSHRTTANLYFSTFESLGYLTAEGGNKVF
jgi:hypothetical protein